MVPGSKIHLRLCVMIFVAILVSCKHDDHSTIVTPPAGNKFTNPIISGSDPWVLQQDSFYYYTQTEGDKISLWKTTAMSKLKQTFASPVYRPVVASDHSFNIWAPEIHRLNNKWYMYYTAGAGPDSTQRLWVLENDAEDPTNGTWVDKGKIINPNADFWSIDASVFEYAGKLYIVWSGRPDNNVQNQNIYISRMSDPLTLTGATVMLSAPQYGWEMHGEVNEAPQLLTNDAGGLMLVYSASGCWTDDYCLGMLKMKSAGDPMVADDWIKEDQPVFVKNPANYVYAPGHNAFFRSRDGSENWIIYHANTNSGDGCGEKRNIRMQKFEWKDDGSPDFGVAVTPGLSIDVPAGE